GQLVHRKLIKPSPDGISLIGERPADEHGFEFAASKDTWVRVVNFANAPDGCLHICDMYREVIEHPWSIPDEIKKHIDLNNGNNRGRIYRIVPEKGAERIGQKVTMGKMSTEELVKTLGHPNGWHRDTAQRLLFERQDKAAVPLLTALFRNADSLATKQVAEATSLPALARLHALGVLKGMGELTWNVVNAAISDTDVNVQIAGLQMSESNVTKTSEPAKPGTQGWKNVERSSDPRVLYQFVLSLGAAPRCLDMIHSLDMQLAGSDKILDAYLASAPDAALPILNSRMNKKKATFINFTLSQRAKIFEAAAAYVAATSKKAPPNVQSSGWTPDSLVEVISNWPEPETIAALARGFKRGGLTMEQADTGHHLTAVFTKAAAAIQDTKATEASRINAIELLGYSSSKESLDALIHSLGEKEPDAIHATAIRVLAQNSSPEVTKVLITGWTSFGPKAKEAALEALLAREDRALALLESSAVKPTEFSASQVQALLKHKSPKVAASAKTALASVIPPSREEVTAKFKPAIAAHGDAKKGQMQYMARCVACHRAGTMGLQVGPDLITVKTKGREALLTAILEPHKEVASQFIAYTVNTKDGQTLAGIITNDTASSMSLKMMGGIEKILQRSEIKGSSSTGQSLMPEGLETGMSVADMADLLSFIEGQ
ncbi:MAG: HEAT repeat domain-containing protein, partial [Prosthecobacter sp.]|uniref:DUF7133 domain-containing protein n=1 Tax=Prosthecobacter sp. TaxID=1965333 RepID=UPI003BB06068